MEKFLNLPEEKQNAIIDAALSAFGSLGYKKASVSDIAAAAGISKSMVFHYFGTKKALYLYLIQLCGKIFMDEISAKFDSSVTDFFDRILLASNIKLSVMKKHPSVPLFLESAYFEADPEVKPEIQALFTSEEGENLRSRVAFDGMDASKFKEGIDPKLVLKMLVCLAYGSMNCWQGKTEVDFDALFKEFEEYMHLLKNVLYKEEYL